MTRPGLEYVPPEIVEEMVRRGELPPPAGSLLALDDDATADDRSDDEVSQQQSRHTTPPLGQGTPYRCSIPYCDLCRPRVILAGLLMLVASYLSGQSPVVISIHAPCTQTLTTVVGAYSDTLAIMAWQLGFISADVVSGAQQFKNGVWRAMLGGCTGQSNLQYTGDCWQSVVNLTATNGVKKWLITPGAPTNCYFGSTGGDAEDPGPLSTLPRPTPRPPTLLPSNAQRANGLMVWKWSGSGYVVSGFLAPPSGTQVDRLSTAVLDGDTAWVKLTQNQGWAPCDLNAGTCAWTTPQAAPPPGEERQANAAGHTYNVGIDFAHPPVNGGPVWFWLARSDVPTPTRPVPVTTASRTPTPTATPRATCTPTLPPNPYASYIEAIWRAGITSGCGGGNFCPSRDMTRQEVATWLAIAMHLPLLPCQGVFADVPCAPTPTPTVTP